MKNWNYNLLNVLRPIKFLPWCLLLFVIYNMIWPTNFGWVKRDIKKGSLIKTEYSVKDPQGTRRDVVTHSFVYYKKNGKEKYILPIMRFNWCDNHTHDLLNIKFQKIKLKHLLLYKMVYIIINRVLFAMLC